jgi:hypothetical protein
MLRTTRRPSTRSETSPRLSDQLPTSWLSKGVDASLVKAYPPIRARLRAPTCNQTSGDRLRMSMPARASEATIAAMNATPSHGVCLTVSTTIEKWMAATPTNPSTALVRATGSFNIGDARSAVMLGEGTDKFTEHAFPSPLVRIERGIYGRRRASDCRSACGFGPDPGGDDKDDKVEGGDVSSGRASFGRRTFDRTGQPL